MIGWNRVTTKRANEILKAHREATSSVDLDAAVCEGNIQLEIKPFESFHQINKYTKYLSSMENIKIVSECWSEDEGYNIIVSVQVPLALGRLLQDMPDVARVQLNGQKHGLKKMAVVLKTPEAIPEPVLV